jgi:hypothetical protein
LDAKEVKGDGMRRSPGFASKDDESEASVAFPEFSSGLGQFPRLQLRDSAGFTPASLSSPRGEDAHTEGHEKERKQRWKKSKGRSSASQPASADSILQITGM